MSQDLIDTLEFSEEQLMIRDLVRDFVTNEVAPIAIEIDRAERFPREIFTKIVIHDTVPFIMAGLRLAIGRALIGMVVAEFFTALSGLGAIIVTSANFFRTDKLFVPILVLAILGVGLTELIGWLERKVAPWKESQRA